MNEYICDKKQQYSQLFVLYRHFNIYIYIFFTIAFVAGLYFLHLALQIVEPPDRVKTQSGWFVCLRVCLCVNPETYWKDWFTSLLPVYYVTQTEADSGNPRQSEHPGFCVCVVFFFPQLLHSCQSPRQTHTFNIPSLIKWNDNLTLMRTSTTMSELLWDHSGEYCRIIITNYSRHDWNTLRKAVMKPMSVQPCFLQSPLRVSHLLHTLRP